jgi:splicing factor 3B subunit 1
LKPIFCFIDKHSSTIKLLNIFFRFLLTGGKTPDVKSRTYAEIMREQQLRAEEAELRKKIQEKSKDGSLKASNGDNNRQSEPKKRGRWDQTIDEQFVPAKKSAAGAATPTWGDVDVS